VTQKLGQSLNIRPRYALGIVPLFKNPWLFTSPHCNGRPIVTGGGDSVCKWPNFRLSRARDLDLDFRSGHTAYLHASLIDLYLHTKFRCLRDSTFSCFDIILACDKRTDRRTHDDSICRASIASLGNKKMCIEN